LREKLPILREFCGNFLGKSHLKNVFNEKKMAILLFWGGNDEPLQQQLQQQKQITFFCLKQTLTQREFL